ncbi:MAG: hypothetical protein H6985_04885 [Pseudomonadales bacterium]|nr:hypothetical protein [Halioglobus sp.]MCP5128905.1 hypothetical protein [Pseudomonadales bacterium]
MQSNSMQFAPAALLSLAISTTVQAAPVSYNEAVDGDLSSSGGSPQFSLDVGSNTVSGTTFWTSDGSLDRDGFGLIVPDGMSMLAITYAWEIVSVEAGSLLIQSGRYLGGDCSTCGSDWANVYSTYSGPLGPDTSPKSLFTSALPLGPGTYTFGDGFGGQAPYGTWDYTFTFEVAAIPLPASAWLFASALAFLLSKDRRRALIG